MKSSRTNRGCRQCRDLIDTLNDQVKELEDRQNSLRQLNSTLIQNLGIIGMGNNQSLSDWKTKYEGEVERCCRLQRQAMQAEIEWQMDRKQKEKKRETVSKLSNLIMSSKFHGLENTRQLTSQFRGRKSSRKNLVGEMGGSYGKNELVVRIVR